MTMSDTRERTEPRKSRPSSDEPPEIRVEDRRHWAREDRDDDGPESTTTFPTVVEEYRARAEAAETRLREYIAAYKQAEAEQEAFRQRLLKDVDRRVELQFSELVVELLDALDDLDLAVAHVDGVAQAEPLAHGVRLVHARFLGVLAKQGVVPIHLDGETFDPNLAEAIRIDPVDDPGADGRVTATLAPGYRLGDRVIRPAKVAVGKSNS
jgi:molecular chaperone GrpE (heat shock protein)